jgi:hypothetical protein
MIVTERFAHLEHRPCLPRARGGVSIDWPVKPEVK